MATLDFKVRPTSCTETSATSTTTAGQLIPVHAETGNAAAADSADMKVAGASEFGVDSFFTSCGPLKAKGAESGELDFSVRAPTTSKNLFRVLRALQVLRCSVFIFVFSVCIVLTGLVRGVGSLSKFCVFVEVNTV